MPPLPAEVRASHGCRREPLSSGPDTRPMSGSRWEQRAMSAQRKLSAVCFRAPRLSRHVAGLKGSLPPR